MLAPATPPEQAAEPAPATEAPAADSAPQPAVPDAAPAPPAEPTASEPTAAPPESPAAESGATQLEDLVVTATKREQSVREIPASINALYGEDLEEIGAREMTDFLNLVPGISLQEGTSQNQRKIAIRGVGPSDGANQTTGILIGDIPFTDPYSSYVIPDIDPFDLQTVEVLKGPQGTLFGASALNGAIRYVPNKPALDTWQGKAFIDRLSLEDGDTGDTWGFAGNLPIGDGGTMALRGVALEQDAPGVYDSLSRGVEDADSRDKSARRLMGTWEATDRLSLNALYMSQETRSDDLSLADNLDGRLERNNTPGISTLITEFDVANLDARYAFDWATLVFQSSRLTKLQDSDTDQNTALPSIPGLQLNALRASAFADIEGTVNELRLVSPDGGDWTWIVGAFHNDYEADIELDIYVPVTGTLTSVLESLGMASVPISGLLGGLPVLATLDTLLNPLDPLLPGIGGVIEGNRLAALNSSAKPLLATEKAAFGEITRKLGDRWAVTVGGRYYKTEIVGTAVLEGLLVPVLFPGELRSSTHHVMRDRGFNPKFALTFQAFDNVLTYANASRGFQFGGVNLLPGTVPGENVPATYDPSTIWSYEIGVRTDWLERTLQADLTAFLLDWKDPQIQQLTSSGLTGFHDNVGGARSEGFETTLRYLTPIPGVSLTGAAAYIKARTTEPYTTSAGEEIPEGTYMPAAPKLQTATTLAYNDQLGDWALGAALTHFHQGPAFSNIQHDVEIYDYSAWDLRFSIGRPDLKFAPALTLAVSNLTDERALAHATRGNIVPGLDPLISAFYIRPRAISLRLSTEF